MLTVESQALKTCLAEVERAGATAGQKVPGGVVLKGTPEPEPQRPGRKKGRPAT